MARGNWNGNVIKPRPRCRVCGLVVKVRLMVRIDGVYPAHRDCATMKNLNFSEGSQVHAAPNLSEKEKL